MKKTAIVLFGSFIVFVGCKKGSEDDQHLSSKLEGRWVLWQTLGSSVPSTSFNIDNDTLIRFYPNNGYDIYEKDHISNFGTYQIIKSFPHNKITFSDRSFTSEITIDHDTLTLLPLPSDYATYKYVKDNRPLGY